MPDLSRLNYTNTHNGVNTRRHRENDGDDPDLEPLSPEEIASFFIMRHGRRFHSHGTRVVPYPLPCDQPEMIRLDRLHDALKMLLGGRNYRDPVQDVLAAPEGESGKVAVDLCTGTGKWVDEMADEFPHVRFYGVDIVPIANEYPLENVWFEVANVMEPLRWSNDTVDLVHMRDASLGVTNFSSLLRHIARVLRPGGLFVSCEWTRQLGTFNRSDPQMRAPNAVLLLNELNTYLSDRGGLDDPSQLRDLITSSHRFHNMQCFRYSVPLDNSDGNVDLQQTDMRRRFKRTLLDFGAATLGFLLDRGWTQEEADEMIAGFRSDIEHVRGLIIYYNVVHARKL